MNNITRSLKIEVPSETAFRKFVHELNKWWPKAYTWSQEKLRDIKIDEKKMDFVPKSGHSDFGVIGVG